MSFLEHVPFYSLLAVCLRREDLVKQQSLGTFCRSTVIRYSSAASALGTEYVDPDYIVTM